MNDQHVTKVEKRQLTTEHVETYQVVCVCGYKSIWFTWRAGAVKAGDIHRANKKVQAL